MKTEYFLNGDQILMQKTGDNIMWFLYDSEGTRVGVTRNGIAYYYLYNLQGDVVGIIHATSGNLVATYEYDAWGNCTVTSLSGVGVGNDNPFRYRGYYYDADMGLYYLNSRYYDAEVGRFISADTTDILGVQSDLYDKNLFAYCDNNPVDREDINGQFGEWALASGGTIGLSSTLSAIGNSIAAALGAITPVGWVIIGVVAIVGTAATVIYAKSKTKEDVDPYARPEQKKQGRELKNKNRIKDNFKPRNNRRDEKPAKPKTHTPSRKGHTKYYKFYP